MRTIQVFDPAMCCSTGICGVDVDESLVAAAADFEWARQRGAVVGFVRRDGSGSVAEKNATAAAR